MKQELKEIDIKPHKINYPDSMLWREDIKEEERIRMINPQDFPEESILSGLGIGTSRLARSFGICDSEEIKRRISLIRFLVEHQEVADWIRKLDLQDSIPHEEKEFLKFYDPKKEHNPYWQSVRDFLSLITRYSESELPERLFVIANTLQGSLLLESSEKDMAEVIADRVQNIAVIEGLASFNLSIREKLKEGKEKKETCLLLNLNDSYAHGHSMFSFALNSARVHCAPYWTGTKWNPANWIGIGRLVKWYINQLNATEREKAYKEMVITKASPGLIADIAVGVSEKLEQIELLKTRREGTEEETEMFLFDGSVVNVYFSYSKKGLWLRIYGIDPPIAKPEGDFSFGKYEGYSPERIEIIKEAQADYIDTVKEYMQNMASSVLLNRIKEKHPMFFEERFSVQSPWTDKMHKWFALDNLYQSPALREICNAVKDHREFFSRHIDCLKDVAKLAASFHTKAKELGTPLCYPEILGDDKSIVDFDEIFPVHLLPHLNGEKPVPIKSLSGLNGNIIVFTGHNRGGKTVAKLSITEYIYLAQSGLPVFGRGFRLNVKKVLGMLFIEKGEGSLCEMLIKKIKNILEGIKNANPGEVVVVLDELGAGTQEVDGLDFGKNVLRKLRKLNVSVLFSTQIIGLAQYAQTSLDAKCFKFNSEHTISPGIGTGHIKELIAKNGLDTLLE